jgi:hypothetical protein
MVDVYAIFILVFILLNTTIFYRNYYLSLFLNKLMGADKQLLDGSELIKINKVLKLNYTSHILRQTVSNISPVTLALKYSLVNR